LEHITAVLPDNTSLWSLDLRYNPIGESGAQAIAKFLVNTRNSGLKHLDLGYCKIGDKDIKWISNALLHGANNGLKRLDLRGNKMGRSGFESIAEALVGNLSLLAMDLRYNDEDPCREIAVRLWHNRTWEVLRKWRTDALVPWLLVRLGVENRYLLLRSKPNLFMLAPHNMSHNMERKCT